MKVAVTGGSGFIGRRFVAHLSGRGDTVVAIVRRPPAAAIAGGRECLYDGTLRHLASVLTVEQPDVVVHLASRFIVQHAPEDIDELVDSNVRFGLQLLEAMRLANARHLVCAGTFWQHFNSAAYRPVNLYAATKQAFEDVCAYYVDAEGFTATHLRLFDVYGPGDERPKLMQYLVECARSGQSLNMSPGEQYLDLVHVDDVVTAFARAVDRQAAGEATGSEVFAVSGGQRVTLRELVSRINRIVGRPLNVTFGGRPYRPREIMQPWQGDGVPGWTPRLTLDEGLREMLGARVHD